MTVKVKLVVKKIQILIPFMLFTKLSTAMTLKSSCNNCKIQWLPIYPPPPVTKMFLPVPGIMLYIVGQGGILNLGESITCYVLEILLIFRDSAMTMTVQTLEWVFV